MQRRTDRGREGNFMYLTEEQKTIGRRNFLKAVAGVPALLALGAAVRPQAIGGGPVKIAMMARVEWVANF
jgi:alpha-D-ribose 1-methylphosphonate 5-phosphate C-P lyase